jgi:tetratricopeptide (TPR) repeat protein
MKFLASVLLALVFVTVESTLGICAQQSASQESAGDHLKRANEFAGSGNLRGAIGEFRAAIHLDPSNANAHWGLAKALHAENPHVVTPTLAVFFMRSKMQDALKEYRTAINLDPKLRDDKTESAELHVQHASSYLGRDFGHWYAYPCGDVSDNLVNHCMDDAAAEYRIALLLDPDYVPAHVGLGVVLAKFHKADPAIEEFRAALRLDPQSAEAHLGLGKSLEKKGNLKDALHEYGSALSLEEGKAKYEKLSARLGIKKEQSQQLGTEKNAEDYPLAPQPLAVPASASEPAPESNMPASEQEPVPKKTDPEDILRGFKSYYIKSDTIYLHQETLLNELQRRGAFSAWELTPTEDSKAADVVITITLPFLTWEWSYRMVYQPTGAELGKGKISAAVEKTAAPQLAAMIVKRIRDVRPLPASFQEVQGNPQALANSRPEKGKSWRVTYISGSAPDFPKDTPVTLTVNREWMTIRHSKTLVFSAPVLNLSALDSRTEVRKATKGWEDFWDSNFPCGDNCSLIIFVAPIMLAGEGILAPIKTTDHFVNMYWVEEGVPKSAEFRASAGDAKSLLSELNKVAGKKVTAREVGDLQELSQKRLRLIAEQFDVSPVAEIDRQVSIGWHTLASGQYHLIVLPREKNLAEVYFLPANKPAPDFSSGSVNAEDIGTQAVAELERRKTPRESKAVPTVSYREQNGIVTFSQIETDELILRFTPIPLGIAK